MPHIDALAERGIGLIGMKLIGGGDFASASDREAAFQYALNQSPVHAVVVGYKAAAEIDEAVERVTRLSRARTG
jgi:vacuolar-type H+-ATPase subunit F/Vma7